jgi:hypothetical protein
MGFSPDGSGLGQKYKPDGWAEPDVSSSDFVRPNPKDGRVYPWGTYLQLGV